MRAHLDDFASLLQTLTQASHAGQSDYVCGLAAKLDETQHLLAELFHELSITATDRRTTHDGSHVCLVTYSTL